MGGHDIEPFHFGFWPRKHAGPNCPVENAKLPKPRDEYPSWERSLGFPFSGWGPQGVIGVIADWAHDWYTIIVESPMTDPVVNRLNWLSNHPLESQMNFRMVDHIGDREKRVNKMPLWDFIHAEQSNDRIDHAKITYCHHWGYELGKCLRSQAELKDFHCKHVEHMLLSCNNNEERLQRMEFERFRRLAQTGVVDAVLKENGNARHFKQAMGMKVIDPNRFRDQDNSWETYFKRKASGEFLKNPPKHMDFVNPLKNRLSPNGYSPERISGDEEYQRKS